MLNLPFDTVGLDADEVDALDDVYKAITAKFSISPESEADPQIHKFDLINCNEDSYHHSDISLGGVLKINHTAHECCLVFIKIRYYTTNRASRGEGLDDYRYKAWGYVNLKKDFGRVLIRRETFTDKVLSIIHPVELEFEDDKAFSRKFYVVANDPDKAFAAMNFDFRNVIMDIKNENMIIEIVNNTLIIGNNYWLDTDEIVYTAEIAAKIASLR